MSKSEKPQLDSILTQVMYSERPALKRLHARACDEGEWETFRARAAAAIARVDERAALVPQHPLPLDLPISEHYQDIQEALHQEQVLVVCGETGSGKSTRLPQICLRAGRGVFGAIGHTQPRRIAARSIAARVRQEIPGGGAIVGSKVRFDDDTGPTSLIKLMTDGITLEEIRHDRRLLQYDTLIIDEAHERSLNIDILLAYLKGLCKQRPELRVIITSATIEPQRFSEHFGGARIIEVSGRSFPISLQYAPPETEDIARACAQAVQDTLRAGQGDILAFLPTERDIRDTARFLHRQHVKAEVLPLFARLDTAAQAAVFSPGSQRRVVLATNVAETSLTVPRIRFVIDTGLARVSRYSPRAGMQRLPVEPIARSAADQRAGRCGRVGPGICIRLYSEEDFEQRPEFTEPEIRRTSLASVVLRLGALGIHDLDRFPFIDAPQTRYVNDAYRLLGELGALDSRRRLSRIGRQLASLPLDPRLARMMLAGAREGALNEILIIVAALSVPDPRERPLESQQAADTAHAAFNDSRSDFLWFINVWRAMHERGTAGRALREFCSEHFLAAHRVFEWREVHRQLRQLTRERSWSVNDEPADYARIHRAILTALLGQIAQRQGKGTYRSARGRNFDLFPGSALRDKKPEWIMITELIETSRVFGRMVARISPKWIRQAAGPMLQKRYDAARFDARTGQVVASETVTLFALIVASGREVPIAAQAPDTARSVFIDEALSAGELGARHPWWQQHLGLRADIGEWEVRLRRRDLLVSERVLSEHFDKCLPSQIASRKQFEHWLDSDPPQLEAMTLSLRELLRDPEQSLDRQGYPDELICTGVPLPLKYRFDPVMDDDGVTLEIPVALLGRVDAAQTAWLIPGLLPERIEAILRTLPKNQRRQLVPISDSVKEILACIDRSHRNFFEALKQAVHEVRHLDLDARTLATAQLPRHLQLHLRVIDVQGRELGVSDSLETLRARFAGQQHQAVSGVKALPALGRKVSRWDFGTLPAQVQTQIGGLQITAWPCLELREGEVFIALADSEGEAEHSSAIALRRLVQSARRAEFRRLTAQLKEDPKLLLRWAQLPASESPAQQFADAVAARAFLAETRINSESDFEHFANNGVKRMFASGQELLTELKPVLQAWARVSESLQAPLPDALRADIDFQIGGLLYPGFLETVSPAFLRHYPRYLQAIDKRLSKRVHNIRRDEAGMKTIEPFKDVLREQRRWPESSEPTTQRLHYLLEELRVSVFAQELGVAEKVSATRLRRYLENPH